MSRPADVMEQALEMATALGGPNDIPHVLVVRVPGEGRLGMVARRATADGPPLGMPLAELAVMAASLQPEACALAMAGRRRDPATNEVVDRNLLVVGIDVAGGGNRMDAVVANHRVVGDGLDVDEPSAVPVAATPLGSLLLDAVVRTRLDLPPVVVAAVLDQLGHRLLVDLQEPLPADHPMMQSVPEGLKSDEARRQVLRQADEFNRRHAPGGSVRERQTAPGVPHDLPAGWLPACPV